MSKVYILSYLSKKIYIGSSSRLLAFILLLCVNIRSYGQLVFGGDTLKGNVKKITATMNVSDYVVKEVLTLDTVKRFAINGIYNESNVLMGEERAKYDERGHIVETGLYSNDNIKCNGFAYKFDLSGKMIQEQYVSTIDDNCHRLIDWYGGMMSNWFTGPQSSRISLSNYQYDHLGRVSEMISKGFTIYLHPEDPETVKMREYYRSVGNDDRDTIASMTNYKYDAQGRVSERAVKKFTIYLEPEKLDTIEINEFQRSVTGNEHLDTMMEITSYRYDTKGNTTQEMKQEVRLSPDYPDTSVKITDYKYDDRGNKIEEAVFEGLAYKIKHWYGDEKQFTIKILYSYDYHNNLKEQKEYVEGYSPSTEHSGMRIGSVIEYSYDSLNKKVAYTSYHLYKEDNGSETREISRTSSIDDETEQEDYDKKGNVIKKTRGSAVIFTREIEYY